jgi:hypothetical protein
MPAADAPPPPSAWVRRFAGRVPEGPVLDLAAGGGRHCRLFLSLGHPVTAVDRDLAGLDWLRGEPGFEPVLADLEDGGAWPLGARRFAGVVVANYLHRPILPAIVAAVGPGGLLLYETFAQGNERFGKPSNPAFLLAPGELIDAVGDRLEVLAYEHGEVSEPKPAVMQRIAARRPG